MTQELIKQILLNDEAEVDKLKPVPKIEESKEEVKIEKIENIVLEENKFDVEFKLLAIKALKSKYNFFH